jgi:cbb3-type cytochrome oxidase subunit 3
LIGSGFVVSWMFVLGLIFLGLWIMALRIGRRTDELKASKKAS